MIAKIQKWGNSQGLRVTRPLLAAAHMSVGEEVKVVAKKDRLVIRRLAKSKVVRIEELVARMPKDYQPVGEGKEVW